MRYLIALLALAVLALPVIGFGHVLVGTATGNGSQTLLGAVLFVSGALLILLALRFGRADDDTDDETLFSGASDD